MGWKDGTHIQMLGPNIHEEAHVNTNDFHFSYVKICGNISANQRSRQNLKWPLIILIQNNCISIYFSKECSDLFSDIRCRKKRLEMISKTTDKFHKIVQYPIIQWSIHYRNSKCQILKCPKEKKKFSWCDNFRMCRCSSGSQWKKDNPLPWKQ